MKPKAKGSKKLSEEDLFAIDLLCRQSIKKFLQGLSPEKLRELFTSSKYKKDEALPKHLRLENLVANQYQEQRLNIDATKKRNLKAAAPTSVAQKCRNLGASKNTSESEPVGVKVAVKKRVRLTVKSGDIPSKKPVGSVPCEWPGCTTRRGSRHSVWKHMNVHLETFKCSVCSKCLESPSELQSHYVRHDSLWPFVCNICSNRYKEKRDLNRHTLHVHSGLPSPYTCPDCVYASWDWGALCRHRVVIHQWNCSN